MSKRKPVYMMVAIMCIVATALAAKKGATRKLGVDEAVELSKQTGRPIMAVAGEAK